MNPLYLQPRANNPSWPTDPSTTPVPVDPSLAPPGPAPSVNVVVGNNGVTVTNGYLTQETCQEANRNGFISAAGYTVGASVLGLVIFLVMRRKLWASAFGRYLTALTTATVAGTALAGLDPVRADVLEQCMHSADFAQYVFLGSQLFARALVLGLIPTLAVTLIACLIANRT